MDWADDCFERIAHCLFCGSDHIEPDVEGAEDWFFGAVPGSFAFARCAPCGSLVLAKRPDAANIARAYERYYTRSGRPGLASGGGIAQRARSALVRLAARIDGTSDGILARSCDLVLKAFPTYREEARAMRRYLPRRPAYVLDYGCGDGRFIAQASALGHHASGVDVDAQAVAEAQKAGLHAMSVEIVDEAAMAGRFDHISLAHVLEHVPDPVALLSRLRGWLAPGGILYLEMPHAHGSGLARFGRFWRGLEAPRHFAIPSARGLAIALRTAGFEIAHSGHRALGQGALDDVSRRAAGHANCDDEIREDASMDQPDIVWVVASPC